MILAGGAGTRLMTLSDKRAKPAVPFAGKFRIIDFTLSNCVHSGIATVGVLTQYQPHSLQDHIGIGKPWDLDRVQGGIHILQPYTTPGGQAWYGGTADAIGHNRFFIDDQDPDLVLILSGDHIYKMDYVPLVRQHQATNADLTVAVMSVPVEETSRFGIIQVDEQGRAWAFHEKPPDCDKGTLASMGIYVFSRTRLMQCLAEGQQGHPRSDFGRDIIPAMIEAQDRVFTYQFDGYWVDVGTLDSYWATNLALLEPDPPLNLYDRQWPVLTRSAELPSVKLSLQAEVSQSMICNGSVIKGKVQRSVLGPGVHVSAGATVSQSIIMNDTWIGPGARLENVVIDKSVIVGTGTHIGAVGAHEPNQESPDKLHSGLTVVGKEAFIPSRYRIGANVLIGSLVNENHFPADGHVVHGTTITG